MEENLNEIYNPEGSELRNAQYHMLHILHFLADICEKHHLKYWIAYGTLLGAVRHKGFIPWDDDVDIEMPYKDYVKLVEILKAESHPDYVFQDHSTDPYYYFAWGKVRERNSVVDRLDPDIGKLWKFKGYYVDIFPVEKAPAIWVRMSGFVYNAKVAGMRNSTIPLCHALANMHYVICTKFLFKIFRVLANLFPNSKLNLTYGCGFTYNYSKDDLYPLGKMLFENRVFFVPNHYKEVLRKIYGNNFMQIPPKEKRIVHTTLTTENKQDKN